MWPRAEDFLKPPAPAPRPPGEPPLIAYPSLVAVTTLCGVWMLQTLGTLVAQVSGLLMAAAGACACLVYILHEDAIVAACRKKPDQRGLLGATTVLLGCLGVALGILTLLNRQFFFILRGRAIVLVLVATVGVGVLGLLQGAQLLARPRALLGDEESWSAMDVGEILARRRAKSDGKARARRPKP